MTHKKTLNTMIASALTLSALTFAAHTAHAMDAPADKEKCYGIAKAGKNDCASSDGAHTCAAAATADSMGTEWIGVPKGLCERIVGGSLEPKATEEKK